MSSPRPHITFFKEYAWPPAAPRPRVLQDRVLVLVEGINTQLSEDGSHRVIDRVVVTANQRLSVRIRGTEDGHYTLRTHWALIGATSFADSVHTAVQKGHFPPTFHRTLEAVRSELTDAHLYTDVRKANIRTRGEHVDLEAALRRVTRFLPSDTSHEGVRITWGRESNTTSARSIRLGSLDGRHQLIRIHPRLDNADIPTVVLDFVVWHELCHYIRPPLSSTIAKDTTDHRIHHRAFRALEARYPDVEAAETWIRRNIDALLRGGRLKPIRQPRAHT